MSFSYPPYREPISDPRTGRVTRAWQRFFDNLISGLVDLGTQVTGTLGLTYLPAQAASTLLGRGSTSAGTPQVLTIGAGLTITGTTLRTTTNNQSLDYYEPLTNGIVDNPELIYEQGDVITVWKRR